MKASFWSALCLLLQASFVFCGTATLQQALNEPQRPSVAQTLQLLEGPDGPQLITDSKNVSQSETVRKMYLRILLDLMKHALTHDVFLLSRDMDALYDGWESLLLLHPELRPLAHKVKTLSFSRLLYPEEEISRGNYQSFEQVGRWLDANQISLARIVDQNQPIFLLDHGYRSRAYRSIYSSLLYQIPESDPDKISKAQRLLDNIDGRLLATWNQSSIPEFKSWVGRLRKDTPLTQVLYRLNQREFYFDSYFPSTRAWTNLGIPTNGTTRGDWLIENIERVGAHWLPRIARLTNDGQGILERESPRERDARIDRVELILRQIRTYHFLQEEENLQIVKNRIEKLLPQITLLAPQLSLPASPSKEPNPITLNGQEYEVIRTVKQGKDLEVFEVKEANGSRYALKRAVAGSTAGVESIQRDITRTKALERVRRGVVQPVAMGSDFILRPWVEGPNGKEWLKRWQDRGARWFDSGLKDLPNLVSELADGNNLYVGNLLPSSMVLTKEGWQIVNPGDVEQMAAESARGRFIDSFKRRWAVGLTERCAELLLRGFRE